ncbi:MAG: 2-dehydro-3-deoxygalactonokinase [Pseudomonadota bacterium]
MRFRTKLIGAAFAVTSTSMLFAGSASAATICFAFQDLETEFWVAGHQAITTTLTEAGHTVIERNANEDANRQLEQVRDCIAQGVDGIIIIPQDGDSATTIVGEAQDVEAGYAGVPAPPLAQGFRRAKAADPRLRVFVLGGLSQTRPADVMRGEETQIAGHLALGGTRDGVVVLPGTHTNWVEIKDGAVFHFASFMTGELFALLAERSVLRHAVSVNGTGPGGATTGTNPAAPIGPDPAAPPAGGEPRSLANADRGAQTRTDPVPPPSAEPMAPAAAGLAVRPSAGPNALSSVPEAPLSDAFRSGFEDAMARPERVAGQLFGLRAERLLDLAPPAALGERLSGLLLGLEFAAARPYWLGQDVALVAAGPLAQRYRAAMDLVGLSPAMADPVATVLAGLAAARRQILEERAR